MEPYYGRPIPKYPCSAIVYKDGNKVIARDMDGKLIAKGKAGDDDASVIQSSLDSLTPGRTWKEKIVLMGDFIIDNSNNPLSIPDHTIFELYGKLTAVDKTKTLVSVGNDVIISGGIYDGNRGTDYGGDIAVRVIHVENKSDVIIRDCKVINGYSRGVEIDYPNNVIVEDVIVDNCWRNIMHWTNTYDLTNHDGVCIIKDVKSINAVENGLDGTSPNLIVDNYHSRNCRTPIAIDGFNKIILNNINVDKNINIVAGSWTGNVGLRCILNNIHAQKIYMEFYIGIEDIQVNNVNLNSTGAGNGFEIKIKTNDNIKNIELNNIEISNFDWSGLVITRDTDVTGIIENMVLNNVIIRDGAQRGYHLRYINYLNLTNCVARGNDWRGFVIEECNYVKMINCNSIKTGAYNQDGPLDLNSVNYFKAIGCLFEYGGVNTTLTAVTNYDFINCEGDYPILRNHGTATLTADGSTTTFTIPHGLVSTPNYVNITPINGAPYPDKITADATNITLTFNTAPASGTYEYWWEARI